MPKFTKKKKQEEKRPADHPTLCPANVVDLQGLPAPRNYFVLNLNLCGESLYENFSECIAHQRWWTFYHSKKRFEYGSPESRSWILPEDGTYLLYVRLGVKLMCFAGIAARSWFQAVLLNGKVFEFSDEGNEEVSEKESNYIQIDEGSAWTRVRFDLSGRYMSSLWKTPLGPTHFKSACIDFYKYINGEISLPKERISCCITTIVVHIWDTACNNDIMDMVLDTFRPEYAGGCELGLEPIPLMKKWKKVSKATTFAIDNRSSYVPTNGTSLRCIPEVMLSVRQFYHEAAILTKFNVTDLPIRMIDGHDEGNASEESGYEDDNNKVIGDEFEHVQYPSWIMRRFVRGDYTDRNASSCLPSPSSFKLPIQKLGLQEDPAAIAEHRTSDNWKLDEAGSTDQARYNDLDKSGPSKCSFGSKDACHQIWTCSGPTKSCAENLTSTDPRKCSEDAKPSEGGAQCDPWASKSSSAKGSKGDYVGRNILAKGEEPRYDPWASKACPTKGLTKETDPGACKVTYPTGDDNKSYDQRKKKKDTHTGSCGPDEKPASGKMLEDH